MRILKRYVAREAFKHLRPDEPMIPSEADQPSTGRETGLHDRLTAAQQRPGYHQCGRSRLAETSPAPPSGELNPAAPETTVAV